MSRALLVVLAASSVAFAQDDPGGWNKSRWGMTPVEVLGVLDGKANWSGEEKNRLEITNLPIGNLEFKVEFLFDKQSKLRLVSIRPIPTVKSAVGDMMPSIESFRYLLSALSEKYGAPKSTTRELTAGNSITQMETTIATWTYPTTRITLRKTWNMRVDIGFIWLHYERVDKSEQDKL